LYVTLALFGVGRIHLRLHANHPLHASRFLEADMAMNRWGGMNAPQAVIELKFVELLSATMIAAEIRDGIESHADQFSAPSRTTWIST
jgi:hypothetical protein